MSAKRRTGFCFCLAIVQILSIVFVFFLPCLASEETNEETYDISLVQTAEVDREIVKVEDRKVLTETYTIKEGEHVWKILRNRGLLEKRNLMEIISVLKKLNSSFANLDIVHPGEKIIIPLVITPLEGGEDIREIATDESAAPLEYIEDITQYTVKPGESVIKIIKNIYDIPEELIFDEYLNQIKKINPDIMNINNIYPGQKIRLPVYSPRVARAPVKSPSVSAAEQETHRNEMTKISDQINEIFSLMGEEWIRTGKQYIPLQTGGQISLNADSYPVLNLRNGNKIILDLYNELPARMSELIMSNWDYYRIVHLDWEDNLVSSINKVLKQCDYNRVYGHNESFNLEGDISININADWIIRIFPEPSPTDENVMLINLLKDDNEKTPDNIRRFLTHYGIKTIDYPSFPESETLPAITEIIEPGSSKAAVIEKMLSIVGQVYSAGANIPVYQKQNSDFSVVIKADYLLSINGRDAVIDNSGLGQEIISLLEEHRFRTLSLHNVKDSMELAANTLEFLGVDFTAERHPFRVTERDEDKNITVTIKGIDFRDKDNRDIFATNLKLPEEILQVLSGSNKKILQLPAFDDSETGR